MKTFLILIILFVSSNLLHSQENWSDLDKRVNELFKEKKYDEAVVIAIKEIEAAEKFFGKAHPNCALSLNNLGLLSFIQNKNDKADSLFNSAILIFSKNKLPDDRILVSCLNNIVNLKIKQNKFAEADSINERVISIKENLSGYSNLDKAKSYDNMSNIKIRLGKLQEAENYNKKSLKLSENEAGKDNPEITRFISTLAKIKKYQYKYSESENLLQRCLDILEKKYGKEHITLADPLNGLGDLYFKIGKFEKSESCFLRTLKIKEKILNSNAPDLIESIHNLANLYCHLGKYNESENLFKRANDLIENNFGSNYPNYSNYLNNLALLYRKLGKFQESEELYKKALSISEKLLGSNNPFLSVQLNNLAEIYSQREKFPDAEELYKKALKLQENFLGKDNPLILLYINNLASALIHQNKTEEVESLYERADTLIEKTTGEPSLILASLMDNQGAFYFMQNKFEKAEKYINKALFLKEKILGADHPDIVPTLCNLAVLYQSRNKYSEAESLYDTALDNLSKQFEQVFAYSSEQDKLSYLSMVSFYFNLYYNFAFKYYIDDQSISKKIYNNILWSKGIVVSSMNEMIQSIIKSGNKNAIKLLNDLKSIREILSRLYPLLYENYFEYNNQIDSLSKESNNLEKELSRISSGYANEIKLQKVHWTDIAKKLNSDEAAIEFVAFKYINRKVTDTTNYYALIISPETKNEPAIIKIGSNEELEKIITINYCISIDSVPLAKSLRKGNKQYELLWKPFEKYLKGVKRVYLSPDGLLNQVSFGVLIDNDGNYISDKYELRYVSNTKDILRIEEKDKSKNYSVFIGNPDFSNWNLDEIRKDRIKRETGANHSRSFGFDNLIPLPGSEIEVKEISNFLKAQNWDARSYLNKDATEDIVKNVESPKVLHLATHGFFEPVEDPDYDKIKIGQICKDTKFISKGNPMLRSGLIFAISDRITTDRNREDGILTAYEASSIDLQNTELVVLSACETGLGDQRIGEGVFGLRRAFQIAGAEAIIMSLWSVPDRETQEMMILFYKKWLKGKDKYAAFREAQLEVKQIVKKRYGNDRPFYWGAFVMVGR